MSQLDQKPTSQGLGVSASPLKRTFLGARLARLLGRGTNLHEPHRALRGILRQLQEGVLGVAKLRLRQSMVGHARLQEQTDRRPFELTRLARDDETIMAHILDQALDQARRTSAKKRKRSSHMLESARLDELDKQFLVQLSVSVELSNIIFGACEIARARRLLSDLVRNMRQRELNFPAILRRSKLQKPRANGVGGPDQKLLKQL